MRVRRWFTAFGCTLLMLTAALSATAPAADQGPRVDDLGSPSKLVIEGAKTFTCDELREALFNELDVVAACDKNASLADLTSVLAKKLTGGYQNAGFPDAKVGVEAADGRLTATIDEGERFTQGEVRIIGGQAIDAERLKSELTPREAKPGKRPVWAGEGHASFDPEYHDGLAVQVATLLANQGFYQAKIKIVVEPEWITKTAALNVVIADEGPRATIGDIWFTNKTRHTSDDILAYLGLDPETPLTSEVSQQIFQRLNRSGRFLSVHWQLGEPGKRDTDWRPWLVVQEYDAAPALAEELTREEAALLKLAEWIEKFNDGDEEILVRVDAGSLVFAPRRGVVFIIAPPKAVAALGGSEFLVAAAFAEGRVGLYSAASRRKIDAAPPPAPLIGNLELTLVEGGKGMSGRGAAQAGVGMRTTSPKTARRHIDLRLKLSAAAALSVVRTHNAEVTWEGDVVCYKWMNRSMRVNSLTGALIDQVMEQLPEGSAADMAPHISITRGEFARHLAEIEKTAANWPNAADERRPLSSLGEFACEELRSFDAKSSPAYAALHKLLAAGALAPFDEIVCQASQVRTDGFTIPQPYFHFAFKSTAELWATMPVLARAVGTRLGNYLLGSDGWMNSVWQKGMFLLVGGRPQAADDLSCQPADDRGPLCALAASEMLNTAGQGELARLAARRGLRRISLPAFRDDCRELLTGSGWLSRCALHLATAWQQLDEEEVKALVALLLRAELLSAEQAAAVERYLSVLAADDDLPPTEAASKALDSLWSEGLASLVEARLAEIADPPPPPSVNYAYGPATNDAIPEASHTPPAPEAPAQDFEIPTGYGLEPVPSSTGRPANIPVQQLPSSDTVEIFPSADSGRPLQQQVRELKWLARSVADRLQRLEEQLESSEPTSNSNATPSGQPVLPHGDSKVGEAITELAIELSGPEGLIYLPEANGARYGLPTADLPTTFLVTSDIGRMAMTFAGAKGREKEPIYAVLTWSPEAAEKLAEIDGEKLSLHLKDEDIVAALDGKMVTITISLIVEGEQTRLETIRLSDAGVDADSKVVRMKRRGETLVTMLLSSNQSVFRSTTVRLGTLR